MTYDTMPLSCCFRAPHKSCRSESTPAIIYSLHHPKDRSYGTQDIDRHLVCAESGILWYILGTCCTAGYSIDSLEVATPRGREGHGVHTRYNNERVQCCWGESVVYSYVHDATYWYNTLCCTSTVSCVASSALDEALFYHQHGQGAISENAIIARVIVRKASDKMFPVRPC